MLFLTLVIVVGLQEPAPEWVEPSGVYAEQVKNVLAAQDPPNEQALRELVALGESVVPTVEMYLNHPDNAVRSRAVRLLLSNASLSEDTIVAMLANRYRDVHARAIGLAMPRVSSPKIAKAIASLIESDPHVTQTLAFASSDIVRTRWTIQSASRELIVAAIMTRIDESWVEPVEQRMSLHREMARMLGTIGEKGDDHIASVCRMLEDKTRAYDFSETRDGHGTNWEYMQNIKRERLLNSLFIARVRLGDDAAIDRFVDETEKGEREVRELRFKQLRYLEADEKLVRMAVRLLDDESEIINAAPTHSQFKYYHRACDLAAAALAHWYEDCPIELRRARVLSPEELQSIKDWAGLKFES